MHDYKSKTTSDKISYYPKNSLFLLDNLPGHSWEPEENFQYPIKMNQANIPGFHRYIRLEQLVSNRGSTYAQNLIKDQFLMIKGTRWLDGSEEVKLFLKQNCSKFYQGLTNEEQKKAVDNGNLTQFDLTLSNTVLRSIPSFTNSDRGKLLKQLVDVRNAIKHFPDLNINHETFERYWESSAKALVEFGMPPDEIENIKSSIHLNSHVLTQTEFNPQNSKKAIKLRKKGKRLVKRKTFQEAIYIFTKGLALAGLRSKDKVYLWSNRSQARILILKNETLPEDEMTITIDSAYKDAQNLISTEPTWCVGYHLIGQVHQYKKEYQEAINWFDRALERNPQAKEAKLFKDVCTLGLSQENGKDYCNPLSFPSSLNEKAEKFRKRRGFGPSGKSLIEAMNKGLRSRDPTRRADASLIKAKLLQVGEDLPLDHKTAFKIYLDLAEQGVIDAFVDVGILYLIPDEEGIEPDVEKGVHWIEKSANAGVAHGLFCLGHLYYEGVGKPQNHCKAMEMYLQASEKGHGIASYNIGLLYLNGIGHCKNEERAKQYLTLAAIREIAYAMDLLAWLYLNEGHVGLALSWYNQAVKYGNVDAILDETKFTEGASLQCRIKIGHMLQQYGITDDCENKTVGQVLNELLVKQATENSIISNQSVGSTMWMIENNVYRGTIWEYRLEIVKRTRQGLPYAKELLNAMDLFLEGWAAMRSDPDRALELFADCIRKSEIVPVFTEMQEFQLGLLCSTITREPILDVSIRICAVRLMGNERNDDPLLLPYLNDCIERYPEEKFFAEVLAKRLASTGRSKESFKTYVNALERFPFDPTLLSGKMAVMKDLIGTQVSFDDVLETCKIFIQKAHGDDNMVPEAYFIMAFMEIFHKNNKVEGEKNYQDGLKAEKNLISYFLPYDSEVKDAVGRHLKEEKILRGLGNTVKKEPVSDPIVDSKRCSRAAGPIRFEITMEHRNACKEFYDRIFSGDTCPTQPGYFDRFCLEPKHHHKPRNLKDLKEIAIQEMYPHGDKIHDGRILRVQIVEMSWKSDTWHSVVKDKYHDCIHIMVEDCYFCVYFHFFQAILSISDSPL
ncbi:unnamed protein product [Allacma fusca]|uniref:Uncharacterized protein n=1 Tax=Allacma fusca TaxID=39272 RepID=A0A8J2L0B0_9HEXA|nr:unnamed protein product [Allacma fusca]